MKPADITSAITQVEPALAKRGCSSATRKLAMMNWES
jgi:hypothetical protein